MIVEDAANILPMQDFIRHLNYGLQCIVMELQERKILSQNMQVILLCLILQKMIWLLEMSCGH